MHGQKSGGRSLQNTQLLARHDLDPVYVKKRNSTYYVFILITHLVKFKTTVVVLVVLSEGEMYILFYFFWNGTSICAGSSVPWHSPPAWRCDRHCNATCRCLAHDSAPSVPRHLAAWALRGESSLPLPPTRMPRFHAATHVVPTHAARWGRRVLLLSPLLLDYIRTRRGHHFPHLTIPPKIHLISAIQFQEEPQPWRASTRRVRGSRSRV